MHKSPYKRHRLIKHCIFLPVYLQFQGTSETPGFHQNVQIYMALLSVPDSTYPVLCKQQIWALSDSFQTPVTSRLLSTAEEPAVPHKAATHISHKNYWLLSSRPVLPFDCQSFRHLKLASPILHNLLRW